MHCCGGKDECQTVCRKNPKFTAQFREIAGFDLDNVPRATPVKQFDMHGVAPLILHGKKRVVPVKAPMLVLKLRDLVNFETGELVFRSHAALADGFKIDRSARLIVTGIEQDKWVEPWWSLGRARRGPLISEMKELGISLITPPNFSLFCDQPRPSDFSAMKRIAMVQAEFLGAGIPCALHPHIVTQKDSERWQVFVASRPEIRTIAYEFTTGAGYEFLKSRHVEHLKKLSENAGRPLDLVLRGDKSVISQLNQYFQNIIYIDTNAFMKGVRSRKMAVRVDNRRISWQSVRTPEDMSLDDLLQHNVNEVILSTRMLLAEAA